MLNFLVFAIIIYLIGVFANLHILYYPAYFFLALHLLLKYYNHYLRKNLELEHQLFDDHYFFNEQITFLIRAENRGRLPVLWLKMMEGLPRKLLPDEKRDVVYLAAGEEKSWDFELKARHRGFYQIGPLYWESGDPFGYEVYSGYNQGLSFYVFPRILNLEELGLPSRLPYGTIKWPQPLYKDPYQLVGIREYQPADSINKIHWKATARTGKLQVRESQSTVSLETAVILNLSLVDYGLKWLDSKLELAVTTAASLASYLNRIGQPFSFKTNGSDPYTEKKGIDPDGQPVDETAEELENQPLELKSQPLEKIEEEQPLEKRAEEDLPAAQETAEGQQIDQGGGEIERRLNGRRGQSGQRYLGYPVGKGELHLQKILELLACLDTTEEDNILDLLSGQQEISWGGTLIIITAEDTGELIQVCRNLLARGYSIKLLLLGERVLHPEYLNRPFTSSLSSYLIHKEEELHGIN